MISQLEANGKPTAGRQEQTLHKTQTVSFKTRRFYVITVESLPGKNALFQKVKIGVR
jgi:hypothetical protein